MQEWGKEREELLGLDMRKDEILFYFDDTLLMLYNWCDHFLETFGKKLEEVRDIQQTFVQLTPKTELEFRSEEYHVRGFVDVVHEDGDEIHIVDYKTNKKAELKDSIRLQLAIYCLLYEEQFGKRPTKAGAYFLRDKVHYINVDDELLKKAKIEIAQIHLHTSSHENIEHYERHITPLCKWRAGQCDFYETCQPHG